MSKLKESFADFLVHLGILKIEIKGFVLEGEIYLPPASLLNHFQWFTHEAGHIIGDALSFKNQQVLTPDEVKNTRVNLTQSELSLLTWAILVDLEVKEAGRMIHLANRILSVYTKDNFHSETIPINYISKKEVLRISAGSDFASGILTAKNRFIPLSNKVGRNEELPAIATNKAANIILKNSIQLPLLRLAFVASTKSLIGNYPARSSHRRAELIVNRAYQQAGMTIPSTLDLLVSESELST